MQKEMTTSANYLGTDLDHRTNGTGEIFVSSAGSAGWLDRFWSTAVIYDWLIDLYPLRHTRIAYILYNLAVLFVVQAIRLQGPDSHGNILQT